VRRANTFVSFLLRKQLIIVTAESCTGGLLAAALSQAEGASDVLAGAFVTYTKDQKTKALGIPRKILERDGAVTADIATRMAVQARARSKADIAISVTGVLGPKPDQDGNPVGLVFIGCARGRNSVEVVEKRFPRMSHDRLRMLTALTALETVERFLRKTKA
jgi:nicotinamide-nucleotide amidase